MSTCALIADDLIHLNLDSAIDIAMNNSYRTKRLKLEIERNIYYLRARKASLHTQVMLKLKSPDLQNISEYKWNSELKKDEIVRVNTALWQSDLALRQPLIFFGYPTNGYLSLNYKLYQYDQRDVGIQEHDVYNRLYLQFEQPLFLPNELKNDLEVAELNLQDVQLDYINERLQIVEDIADDYFELFRTVCQNEIYLNHMQMLAKLTEASDSTDISSSIRAMEKQQIELEKNNVHESLLDNQSRNRQELADMKQRLRLAPEDSLQVSSDITLTQIDIDLEQAMQLGFDNSPYLQQLHLSKRRAEIDVENAKANNAFHMSLEMTYGLEKQNNQLQELWDDFDNSKSLTLNAYLPLWDGGVRRNNIQAEKLDVSRRQLEIEEEKEEIHKDIINAFTDLRQFYARVITMQTSVQLSQSIADSSLRQFQRGMISLQDVLQILNRNRETEEKFLAVYLDYRRASVDLMTETCYDFDKGRSLFQELNLLVE